VVIAAGDGATNFLPAVLFFAGVFFVATEVAFFEAVCFKGFCFAAFFAAFFPLFFAGPVRVLKVAADLFLEALVFEVLLAFFVPFLLPFLATISILPCCIWNFDQPNKLTSECLCTYRRKISMDTHLAYGLD